MMRPRWIKAAAIVLALVAALTAFLGYDAVFEQNITDTFISHDDNTLNLDL